MMTELARIAYWLVWVPFFIGALGLIQYATGEKLTPIGASYLQRALGLSERAAILAVLVLMIGVSLVAAALVELFR